MTLEEDVPATSISAVLGYEFADRALLDLALAHSPASSIVEGMVTEAQKLLHRAGSLIE